MIDQAAARSVRRWLWAVYLMVFSMVIIGGVTRLTGSGLSMVEWKPLMGTLPPLSDQAWQETFDKYKKFPQYQKVNSWMKLDDFKRIYFWEYLHRLWGRLIGLVFFVPWLVLLIRRKLRGPWIWRTTLAFVLGGLQGVMGWVMVRSGLVNRPEVSHFRLAAHFALACIVACWVFWLILGLRDRTDQQPESKGRWSSKLTIGFLIVVSLQMIYGAFMAGKKAGLLFATFPDMNGSLFPAQAFGPGLANYVSNPIAIHALHRLLGWLVLAFAVAIWIYARRREAGAGLQRSALAIFALTIVQFALGVLTVVLHVPIVVATLHQAIGFLLLTATIYAMHCRRVARNTP